MTFRHMQQATNWCAWSCNITCYCCKLLTTPHHWWRSIRSKSV